MFTNFVKSARQPTKEIINQIKTTLLNSKWHLEDESLSSFKAKQLFVTIQSVLDRPQITSEQHSGSGSTPPTSTTSESSTIPSATSNATTPLPITTIPNFNKPNPLPPGYSLLYCNPLSHEFELSRDGYDNYHAPTFQLTDYFKRRMWLSGEFQFNVENKLKFGDSIEFQETVDRVRFLGFSVGGRNNKEGMGQEDGKGNKGDDDGMIICNYRRQFNNQNGPSLTELRSFGYLNSIYQTPSKASLSSSQQKDKFTSLNPDHSKPIKPSKISNLRMSMLTFNTHQIHYDLKYSTEVENYPAVVLQAPLLIQLILSFWNQNSGIGSDMSCGIEKFKYSICSPCFVDDLLSLNFKRVDEDEGTGKKMFMVWIRNLTRGDVLSLHGTVYLA
ncbi:unnamed protein product [Ambrosiozyma monospora]|uniref:Unnamed protein product n=1 Tax=Ambrosiozyma monospora TaxID=43982 RepID=A0A9W6YXY6_AMBMO|nr:unnamed protein product [Ambrosiozyma monospora]